ncbi:MAG TPA: ATP-binding protein [Haliangium sp.]|nr:ATP-binding protein [Haliangium sp.]
MVDSTRSTRQWTWIFAGIFALVMCLQVATLGLVQYFGAMQRRHFGTLSVASNQIFLIEQFERASYLALIGLANSDLELVFQEKLMAQDVARQFQAAIEALRDGTPTAVGQNRVSVETVAEPETLAILTRLEARWREVQAAQVRVLRSKNYAIAGNSGLTELRVAADVIRADATHLMHELGREYATDLRVLGWVQAIVPLLALGGTLLLAGLVLRKLVVPFGRTMEELRASRSDLQRAHDQLEQRVDERTRELAETNQVLRDQSEVLESVLESMAEGVAVVASDGTFRVWNAEAARIVAVSPRELEHSRWLEACPSFHADGVTAFERHELPIERALAGEAAMAEMLVRCAGDEDRWLSWAARPLTTPRGEGRGAVAVFRDDTLRKQAEARLRQSHDELEQRVAERTRALREAQRQLVDTALAAGKAEVATNILHNVGNVLNGVNVLAQLIQERLQARSWDGLSKTAALVAGQRADLGRFFTEDERGRRLPEYLEQLAARQSADRAGLLENVDRLLEHIEHIKRIVALQQEHARSVSLREDTALPDVLEDALSINMAGLERHDVTVVRDYQVRPRLHLHKHKLLQILINLISNAKYALADTPREERRITLRMTQPAEELVRIEVIDSGCGIPAELLTQIFQHGFTTRAEGHGFGLHASVLAARDLGGSLHAHSDGPGKGACFTLEIPTAQEREATH